MVRQSPSESVTDYKVGTRMKGTDGNCWVVKAIPRWVKDESGSCSKGGKRARSNSPAPKKGSASKSPAVKKQKTSSTTKKNSTSKSPAPKKQKKESPIKSSDGEAFWSRSSTFSSLKKKEPWKRK
jgi:cell division septation protein DedD